jgi:probable phosphoglycerate mutase
MTPLATMRHAPTCWNQAGLMQGRADPPLSERGRAAANHWRLPEELATFRWLASPLRRALETADCLAIEVMVEPALIEMDWGDWEGLSLADLRTADPEGVAANEARGLDFTPPAGESPRQVQERLRPLLVRLGAEGRPTAAITHKGVLRALLALATGWDMRGKAPVKLQPGTVHLFALGREGRPHLARANIRLMP